MSTLPPTGPAPATSGYTAPTPTPSLPPRVPYNPYQRVMPPAASGSPVDGFPELRCWYTAGEAPRLVWRECYSRMRPTPKDYCVVYRPHVGMTVEAESDHEIPSYDHNAWCFV